MINWKTIFARFRPQNTNVAKQQTHAADEHNENWRLIFDPIEATETSDLVLTVQLSGYTFDVDETVLIQVTYEYRGDNSANSVDDIMSTSTPAYTNSPGDLQIAINSPLNGQPFPKVQDTGDYDFTQADIDAGFIELAISGTGTVDGVAIDSNTVNIRIDPLA